MDNIRHLVQRERRLRALPKDARCATCGATEPWALIPTTRGRWRCYECHNGHPTEAHHVAGLGRGPTVIIRANPHRLLSALQEGWPSSLRYRRRSPVQELSATALGLVQVADQFAGWPFQRLRLAPGQREVRIPLARAPAFNHVFGTDAAWYRPPGSGVWRPCPIESPAQRGATR
ncbi:MAG: hypothetical protein CL878_13595 [Dehalococcoidia bacterium]|nr:hypothetical protein [Dehalococcoidia bacterium]